MFGLQEHLQEAGDVQMFIVERHLNSANLESSIYSMGRASN